MITYSGVGGLARDLPNRETPPEFVQVAHNVTASRGKYVAVYGYTTLQVAPPEPIVHMQALTDANWAVFLLVGDTKAYSWDGTAVVDITDTPLKTLVDDERWSSAQINGMGLLAQINDFPHAYGDPSSPTTKLQYLPWDENNTWADKNVKTGIIRNYKNFIVTLGEITEDSDEPRKVRWSASVTDTGVLPYWEPLPENDAGFVTLADLETEIVDGQQLGDGFIIYSRVSAYLMQYVGGTYKMRFQRLDTLPGVMRKGLVMPFEGNKHFVVGQSDIYIHGGGSEPPVSIVDKRIRRAIYEALNETNIQHSFLVKNTQYQEIWICGGDEEGATTAYAWSWKYNTWTTRPLPMAKCYYGESGVTPGYGMTYETIPYPNYESIPGTYTGLGVKLPDTPEMVFATTDAQLIQRTTGILEGSEECGCRVERYGLPIGEYEDHYTLITVYPSITVASATVQVGMQDHEGSPIRWSKKQLFNPTDDKKIDVRGDNLTGSLFCYRVFNESPALFEFTGMQIEVEASGRD